MNSIEDEAVLLSKPCQIEGQWIWGLDLRRWPPQLPTYVLSKSKLTPNYLLSTPALGCICADSYHGPCWCKHGRLTHAETPIRGKVTGTGVGGKHVLQLVLLVLSKLYLLENRSGDWIYHHTYATLA